jgi:hypothetical protein
MHKSKTNNQDENDIELWGWWLSLAGVKLHEIKSLKGNYSCNTSTVISILFLHKKI